jgi:hypothetical protein
MATDKAQYVVALITEFASHYGLTTTQAVQYLSKYDALMLFSVLPPISIHKVLAMYISTWIKN